MSGGDNNHEENPASRSDPEDGGGAASRYARDVDTNRADKQYPEDDYDRENRYGREDRYNRQDEHNQDDNHDGPHHHERSNHSHDGQSNPRERRDSHDPNNPRNRPDTRSSPPPSNSPLSPPQIRSPQQEQQPHSLHRDRLETIIWSLKSATWNEQHESNARVESMYQDIARMDRESDARIRREDRERAAVIELMFVERGLGGPRYL